MKKSTFSLILKFLVSVVGAILATLTAHSCSQTAYFSKQKHGPDLLDQQLNSAEFENSNYNRYVKPLIPGI